MLIGTLATYLMLQVMPLPDTVVDPATIYAPVVEHLRENAPTPSGLPVVLDANVYPGLSEGEKRTHSADVSRRLQASGCVQVVCDPTADPSRCPEAGEKHISIRLGEVIHLPDGAKVKVLPTGRDADTRMEELLASIPDSMAVPVDVAVDVVLGTPCPAPPESERCRVPDIVTYRYFLRVGRDGEAHVVTRWFSGAA